MDSNHFDNFFVIKEHGERVLLGYKENIVGTLTIPEGVTKISEGAFTSLCRCRTSQINKIVFPHSLKRIPKTNFEFWEDLTEVVIPEGVVSIADGAFMGTGLQEVTLPGSIEKIGKHTFELCDQLKKVTVNHISAQILNDLLNEYNAFYHPVVQSFHDDNRLKFQLFFSSSNPVELTACFRFYDKDNKRAKYSTQGSGFILYGNCIIGYVGNEVNLRLPESAKEIGISAFKNNPRIQSIVFNEKMEYIGVSAFEGCSSLHTVELNSPLEFIGPLAFAGTKIKNISIPRKVKYIGEYAFSNCPQLETITIFKSLNYSDTNRLYKWNPSWKNGFNNQITYEYDI